MLLYSFTSSVFTTTSIDPILVAMIAIANLERAVFQVDRRHYFPHYAPPTSAIPNVHDTLSSSSICASLVDVD